MVTKDHAFWVALVIPVIPVYVLQDAMPVMSYRSTTTIMSRYAILHFTIDFILEIIIFAVSVCSFADA